MPTERRLPRRTGLLALVALAAVLTTQRPSRGDDPAADDPWRAITSPRLTAAAATSALAGWVEALGTNGAEVGEQGATRVLGRPGSDAAGLAVRVDAVRTAVGDVLRAAGLTPDAVEGAWTVVHAIVPDARPLVAATTDGAAVLVRVPAAAAPPTEPTLPARADGPLLPRDLEAAADHGRRFAAATAAAADLGGSSPWPTLAARRALADALPPKTPAWLVEGLVVWAAQRAAPDAGRRVHVCGAGKGAAPPAAAVLLDPRRTPTPGEAAVVGQALAEVLGDATDVRARVEQVAASADRGPKAFEAAFGRPATDALGAAWAKVGDVARAFRCTPARTLPCTLCKATGRVEFACLGCTGTGRAPCPSCLGRSDCPCPSCSDGQHERSDGSVVTCAFCDGDQWCYCVTCDFAGGAPCKPCGGRGKATAPCPACAGTQRVPCPYGGASPVLAEWLAPGEARCVACSGGALGPCTACLGTLRRGCTTCRGPGHVPCTSCGGPGCGTCNQRGYLRCSACGGEPKGACGECGGKGVQPLEPARCWLCAGTGRARGLEAADVSVGPRTAAEREAEQAANAEALRRAVEFLLSSRTEVGFALRHPRAGGRGGPTPALYHSSLYANAEVLTTLFAAGVGPEDPRVAPAFATLRTQLDALLGEARPDTSTQSVAISLSALLLSGEDPRGPRIERATALLRRGQRSNGLWGSELLGTTPGDTYSSLYAIEALWTAARRGAKVPSTVWERALPAAQTGVARSTKGRKAKGWDDGTDVASGIAIVAMTRAAIAGTNLLSLAEYKRIPAVDRGLRWLDRYHVPDRCPVMTDGTLTRAATDAGYAAYLYAIERACSLLSIETLAGRRWYDEAASTLRRQQLADGSFEELGPGRLNGSVRTTTSAVRFFLRSTPPITSEGVAATDGRGAQGR